MKQNEDKIISCQDMTKPSTITQLLFSRLKHIMYNDDNKRAAAACERSKLVFKTLSLQPLLGLRGGSPGGFHDPRLSSSDGMGYTLHCAGTGCTVNWTKYNTD